MYPLAYELFGGRNWSSDKDARWDRAHRPPGYSLRQLGENLVDVTVRSDQLSPLLFALAPLALVLPGRRRAALAIWLFAVYVFVQWWLFTHRIDRFWLPMLPLVALLAGAGARGAARVRAGRPLVAIALAVCIFYNFSYSVTALCGYNEYTERLDPERRDPTDWLVRALNERLPPGAGVLAVGAADLFHLDRAVVYNTVFDDSIFEQLVRGRGAEEIAGLLAERGITHVYVSWEEVERYRSPGSYGFPEFVMPEAFERLVEDGVLRRVPLGPVQPARSIRIGSEPVPPRELYAVHPR